MCLWRDVNDVKGETSWVGEAYACVWEREKGERKGIEKRDREEGERRGREEKEREEGERRGREKR